MPACAGLAGFSEQVGVRVSSGLLVHVNAGHEHALLIEIALDTLQRTADADLLITAIYVLFRY